MENKYYTPDISEFYIGFEYERSIFKSGGSITGNFSTKVYNPTDFIEYDGEFFLQEYIDNGIVRVKYLDKQDIEELGFTFLKADDETYLLYYAKEDVILAYMDLPTTDWIELYTTKTYDPNGPRIFKGYIKNKSELRQVLKMLDIDYEG